MTDSKPVLLASDAHLGASPPDHARAFLSWLEYAADRASEIVINGDLFDFWFEYRWGVTRGHGEVLSCLREVVGSGVPVTLMGGNHDWWGGAYLRDEIGLRLLWQPEVRDVAGRTALLAHGDGVGSGDTGYRLLRVVLRSPLTRGAFSLLPVGVGDRVAAAVSTTEERWGQWGPRQEARSAALEAWAVDKLRADPELDLVLLGHTHMPLIREVEPDRWYVNSGDWVSHQSYVELEPGSAPRLLDWRDR